MDTDGGAGAGADGSSILELYTTGRRLVLNLRGAVERLESFRTPSGVAAVGIPPELVPGANRDIAKIRALCAELNCLWRLVGSRTDRDLWRRKVEQLEEEVNSLKDSLDKSLNRQQKLVLEAKERAELFHRAKRQSSYNLRVFDEEAQAMVSAQNSSQILDESYSTGVAILSKYAEQRDTLKRAQRRALDMLNTVGLSNSVLKLIERKHRTDKWVAYFGMILVIFFLGLFWRWIH